MSTLEIDVGDIRPVSVAFTADELVVTLADGRRIANPLKWYPRLWEASHAARRRFDWETMFKMALDPAKARRVRCQTEDKDRDVCTMCGELCAMKTYERFEKATRLAGGPA